MTTLVSTKYDIDQEAKKG